MASRARVFGPGRLALVAAAVVLLLAPGGVRAQRGAPAAARPARVQRGRGATRARARAEKRVFVLVGMPGAGKSTAADRLAARLGTTRLSTGDVIRRTIRERGLRYSAATDRAVAEEIARKPGWVGRQTAARVAADPHSAAVVEGFRAVADLDAFLETFPRATVIAVEVGAERRHQRMLARGRAGEDSRAYLRDRDRAEVRRGVKDVMRRATVRIRPRGDGFDSLDRSLSRVLSGP